MTTSAFKLVYLSSLVFLLTPIFGISSAKGDVIEITVMLDPFRTATGTLEFLEQIGCKESSSPNMHTRTCDTPGARLTLISDGKSKIIPISSLMVVTSDYLPTQFVEYFFLGSLDLDGKEVRIALEYAHYKGANVIGRLRLSKEMVYPTVVR
jgi:hypothetical protein